MPPSEPPHCRAEELALLSLGEPAEVDADHLAGCAECARELDALRATVRVARAGSSADAPQPPPPAVWHRVAAELGLSPVTAATGAEHAATADELHADVVPLPAPPRRRLLLLAGAAAAVAGLVVGGTGTWLALRDDAGASAREVIATATLEPLPEWADASGDADVERNDGRRILHVDLRAPVAGAGALREVWLLDRGAQRLVSLGLLPGSSGDFPLPAGLDLATYPVVDVSQEPDDGNPAHSGDSIVRGTLDS